MTMPRQSATTKTSAGFTLTEMLVALAVGMFILNIAFASFFFTQKFMRKIEVITAKNNCAQSMIAWSLTGKTAAFPSTIALFRGVHGEISDTQAGGTSNLQDVRVFTSITPMSFSRNSSVAQINVRGGHGLISGQHVRIKFVGPDDTTFNGDFRVKSTIGQDSFTFNNAGADTAFTAIVAPNSRIEPQLSRLCIPKSNS